MAALLASPDEGSRRTGLETLARGKMLNRTIHYAFLDDSRTRPAARDGRSALHTLLRPLAGSLARIAREPGPADLRPTRPGCSPTPRRTGPPRAPSAGRGRRAAGPRDGRHRPDLPGAGGPSGAAAVDARPFARIEPARAAVADPALRGGRDHRPGPSAFGHGRGHPGRDAPGRPQGGCGSPGAPAQTCPRRSTSRAGRSGRHDLRASRPRGQPPRRPLAHRGRRPDRRETRPGRALPPP